MPQYQPNVPTGSVPLNIDWQNLQGNFQTINTTYGIDHVPFANATPLVNGFHGDIHFNPVSTTATNMPNNYDQTIQFPQGKPGVVVGIGQLFSATVNDATAGVGVSDTGLYWLTGNGLQVALTRNFVPSHADTGYTFLPGGIIFQWGYVTPGFSGAGVINFPRSFPNRFFNIQITMNRNSSNVDTIYATQTPANGPISQISVRQTSSNGFPFYWTAIGY
jgi:hypothetical protein